jgi:TolB protein
VTRVLCLALSLLAAAALPAAAQEERPTVVVTPGQSTRSFRVALQSFADRSPAPARALPDRLRQGIAAGLEYSDVFQLLDPAAFLGPATTASLEGDPPLCSDWTQVGADALVQGEIEKGAEQLAVRLHVWDTARCQLLLRKRYSQEPRLETDGLARRIADDIVAAFTGVRGVSATEIAFVSDRGGNSEIYVMNADGSDVRRATSVGSINNFPGWAPGGDRIVFTSYRHRNRPFLWSVAPGDGPARLLFSRLAPELQQYRGVFDPSGQRLALVMSNGTAADIYTVTRDGRQLRQLTRDRAIDVSPSWSPDGSRIAFVSDRTGVPQVYRMDADGGNVERLTWNGSYNTNPTWSPDGSWIAYESRVGGQLDLWLIDPERGTNVPVVTHERNDEGPTWAPNGLKLAFSSTRRGRHDLYTYDLGSERVRQLTRDAGNNRSPAWGGFPR